MVIKVAVPHQFKLKVIPDFRSLFFSDKKDMLGISQSYISRLEKKIMQRLRREMVKYS